MKQLTLGWEIKPCGFCGHLPTPAIMRWPRGQPIDEPCTHAWTMQCTHCGASGPTMPTEEEAERAWQTSYWPSESWDCRVEKAIQDGHIKAI